MLKNRSTRKKISWQIKLNFFRFKPLLKYVIVKQMLSQILQTSGADALKKFTPSLGIPYLGVRSKIWEPLVTTKSGLLNFWEIGV